MSQSIFYSWQSDLHKERYTNFIRDSIDKSIKNLRKTYDVIEAIRRDEATTGIPGWPEVGQAILKKISECSVFVADISIINSGCHCFSHRDAKSEYRRTPNPNVIFELGYAMATISRDKIICIFNLDSGTIERLPFDIRGSRPLTYKLAEDDDKASIRQKLVEDLTDALSLILYRNTKNKLTAFLRDTNPKIIRHIEAGERELSLLIAQSRLGLLAELQRLPDFEMYAKFDCTGSMINNLTNGMGTNDQAPGTMIGYVLTIRAAFDAEE